MKKEKLTEKIKLEYDLYKPDYVYRIDYVYDIISHSIKLCNSDILYLSREKLKNQRARFFSRILGEVAVEYGLFRPDFYTKDTKLIDLQCRMTIDYRRRMNELFEVLSEDNMQEIYRLGMFSIEKHYQNSVYMTGSRKMIECDGTHYACMTLTLPIDEAGFGDFFDSELERIRSIASLQYYKK